jgi:hypothetical protein
MTARYRHIRPGALALVLVGALGWDCRYHEPNPYVGEQALGSVINSAFCGPVNTCGNCDVNQYVCTDAIEVLVGRWSSVAQDAGLYYNDECAQFLNATNGGCPTQSATDWVDCEHECQHYYGEAVEGEACQIYGHRMSNCALGLACGVDGICHLPCDVPTTAVLGQRCGVEWGVLNTPCVASLVCGEGVCTVGGELGVGCGPGSPCGADLWCDNSTCTALVEPGGACSRHEMCESLICEANTCRQPQASYCSEFFLDLD